MLRVDKRVGIIVSAILVGMLMIGGAAQAQELPELPATFSALLVKEADPGYRPSRVSITVENWSTDVDRKALKQALEDGGMNKLVEVMRGYDMGYGQLYNSLGIRLRLASAYYTEEGWLIRVATDRPITEGAKKGGQRSVDYPVGLIEITLPHDGEGEGTVHGAIRAQFNEEGQIGIQSLEQGTGPQKLMGVEMKVAKKKKKDK